MNGSSPVSHMNWLVSCKTTFYIETIASPYQQSYIDVREVPKGFSISDFIKDIVRGIYFTPSSSSSIAEQPLLIVRRHLILNIAYQRDPHFSRVVAAQHIADEASLDLHLHLHLTVSITTTSTKSPPSPTGREIRKLTISKAPLKTPQRIFEYHNSSCALPSSGNSTKSANGFSSNTSPKLFPSWLHPVTVGVTFMKTLNPTLLITSAVSRKVVQ